MGKIKVKSATKTFKKQRRNSLEKLVEDLEAKPGVTVKSTARVNPSHPPTPPRGGGSRRKFVAAKARYYQSLIEQPYRGVNKYYREYRRNFLVRKAIDSLAFWSVKEGFETVLEPAIDPDEDIEQYSWVKDQVDRINHIVNLDNILRVAIVKMKIYGRAAFEIEFELAGKPWTSQPVRLIPLDSTQIRPDIDEGWNLTGYTYEGMKGFYTPEEILYFVNSDLEGDLVGLSDVEPVLKEAELDDKIIREDLAEAATTLWAGIAVHTLLTEKLPEGTKQEEIQKIIDDHIAELKPGKHIATTDQWQIQTVDIKPDLDKLINISDKVERRIVGNFQVPRFMLNIEKELNRATAYAELEAFIDGPITDIQRILKRTLEAQWYPRIIKQTLKINSGDPPIQVKHKWREIRTADWFELVKTVNQAYSEGRGWADRKKIYEMMRDGKATSFDPAELQQP
ncbi:MAG: phage portal protein [Candidatus Bathyarchaeia archaeon]